MSIRIDVWSDVVCPWCYIGKRRLETALGRFEHDVTVTWHSFQLDPTIPQGSREPVHEMLAKKIGAPASQVRAMTHQVTQLAEAEGLTYDLGNAISVNTRDAHRVAHLAGEHGLGTEMHEALLKAHLSEAAVVDDPDTLVRLAAGVGVPAEEAADVVRGTKYGAEVDADIQRARQLGISGVPFFLINQKYGISGAQSADAFLGALNKVHAES
ncbi:DsbA family oxidoreductase [Actinoplanes xinjiangensis]|uniref:Putative DsbA family dithiol-disulfide isomerase n=1 Tax=Actinoplanes xinjiangensis TaxID=512350 RepID=A0A316EJ04_9ACTN|nr:DsbA family oxidoreductase [Actinoplanes xinjiangensis]PWK30472.1 putative DsbA family dithiol-disulfide isomerase [Actinoplanes xinjiangensis]GIF44497.1 DSBA oxidoreductase [Actinoplanes xinjiangensis]